MPISRYLEEIIAVAERSDLPKAFLSQVVAGLRYFHQQSLCDYNRRDTKAAIKARWFDLEMLLLGSNLLDKFKVDESKWSQIELFVGVSSPKPFLPPPPKPKSRHHGKDVPELFEYLARTVECKPVLTAHEGQVLKFGLYYLELETKRGRGQRNRARIKETWKIVQPILRRMGLLDEFDREPDAKRKIKSFVADRFL